MMFIVPGSMIQVMYKVLGLLVHGTCTSNLSNDVDLSNILKRAVF